MSTTPPTGPGITQTPGAPPLPAGVQDDINAGMALLQATEPKLAGKLREIAHAALPVLGGIITTAGAVAAALAAFGVHADASQFQAGVGMIVSGAAMIGGSKAIDSANDAATRIGGA